MTRDSNIRLIDLYIYRAYDQGISFLLLKRSPVKIYAGQWRMVGGKVNKGETRWRAALREMEEETALFPELFWSVPTINHFYEPKRDQIHLIPVFAAQVSADSEPSLDKEHSEYKWIQPDQIIRYLHWPEQRRIISCIEEIVLKRKILDEWKIDMSNI